jgi:hypothetical protein
MPEIRKISAYSAALVVFSLASSAAGSFEAKAGGGRSHQNLSGPPATGHFAAGAGRQAPSEPLWPPRLRGASIGDTRASGLCRRGDPIEHKDGQSRHSAEGGAKFIQ